MEVPFQSKVHVRILAPKGHKLFSIDDLKAVIITWLVEFSFAGDGIKDFIVVVPNQEVVIQVGRNKYIMQLLNIKVTNISLKDGESLFPHTLEIDIDRSNNVTAELMF